MEKQRKASFLWLGWLVPQTDVLSDSEVLLAFRRTYIIRSLRLHLRILTKVLARPGDSILCGPEVSKLQQRSFRLELFESCWV